MMNFKQSRRWVQAVMVLVLGFSTLAWGANYTWQGELSYPDGGFWALADAMPNSWLNSSELSWEVSNEKSNGPDGFDWFYSYTMNVHKFATVRWVIETGPGFTMDNIRDISVVGEDANAGWDVDNDFAIGTWDDQSIDGDLRDMPEARYGLLFTNTSVGGGGTGGNEADDDVVISFWSNLAPQWGDAYANCGGNGNRGWNEGFTTDNPTDPPDDGTIYNHVLVPTPEPSMLALLLLGGGLAALKRRRPDSA